MANAASTMTLFRLSYAPLMSAPGPEAVLTRSMAATYSGWGCGVPRIGLLAGPVNAVRGHAGREFLNVADGAEHRIEPPLEQRVDELCPLEHVELDIDPGFREGSLNHLADGDSRLVGSVDQKLPVGHVCGGETGGCEQLLRLVDIERIFFIVCGIEGGACRRPRQGHHFSKIGVSDLQDPFAIHQVIEGLAEFLRYGKGHGLS